MIRGVNVLALLVVVTAGVLVGLGRLDAEAFLLLVTGLAIPARADGYQSVGTGPQQVVVTNTAADAVPVEVPGDSGHADPAYLVVMVSVAVIVVTLYHLIVT